MVLNFTTPSYAPLLLNSEIYIVHVINCKWSRSVNFPLLMFCMKYKTVFSCVFSTILAPTLSYSSPWLHLFTWFSASSYSKLSKLRYYVGSLKVDGIVNCRIELWIVRFVSYDVICMSYITKFILTKQIYLNFNSIYLKSSINV